MYLCTYFVLILYSPVSICLCEIHPASYIIALASFGVSIYVIEFERIKIRKSEPNQIMNIYRAPFPQGAEGPFT